MKAPFPWFGGKSRAAHLVWSAFGDVPNYVEPFAGSLAVLLSRPHAAHIETVNDLDCYLANFWRAVAADSAAVADAADWPVSEADLHARHNWLVNQAEFRERMKSEPDFYDAKVAGWWVWGLSAWLGSGWCDVPDEGGQTAPKDPEHVRPGRQLPVLSAAGRGINRAAPPPSRRIPHVSDRGTGVHAARFHSSGTRGAESIAPPIEATAGTLLVEGHSLVGLRREL